MPSYLNIGKSVPKIDARALATAQEQFTDDVRLEDALHLAFLYSEEAHADIAVLDVAEARRAPGVAEILTYHNVPRIWHTTAGQGYPEPSPYDNLLFDKKVRFVGDRIALVAAESQIQATAAVQLIKVELRRLDPLFDAEEARAPGAPRIHGAEEHAKIPVAYDSSRNLAAEVRIAFGDVAAGFVEADHVIENTYAMQYASHCAIEPHAVAAYFDTRGRLVLVSTTQVPFHARRIVSMVTGIPLRDLRVIKPRIGGGFGGKQEVFLEPLVALIAWRTKRPVKLLLSRREVFISARTRHPMRVRLKTGFMDNGHINAIHMDCLMNTGAYGSHALTVLSNAGAKVLPLFNKTEHLEFIGRSVYTNLPVGGAYRGYGATQGYFAFNQQIDIIARATGQDVLTLCKREHIKTGETSGVFEALGEGKEGVTQVIASCGLGECIDRGAEAIGWATKRDRRNTMGRDSVRGVGMAIGMQGSGIPKVDMGSAAMKMNEDGSFNLYVGATDIGTGSDTILAQIAAEVLHVTTDSIIVLSSDTDLTPFDVGAYASSTTYISGAAVKKCAERVVKQIVEVASTMLGVVEQDLVLQEAAVAAPQADRCLSFSDIAVHSLYAQDQFQIQAQASQTARKINMSPCFSLHS